MPATPLGDSAGYAVGLNPKNETLGKRHTVQGLVYRGVLNSETEPLIIGALGRRTYIITHRLGAHLQRKRRQRQPFH
jgi:hypothetical protein